MKVVTTAKRVLEFSIQEDVDAVEVHRSALFHFKKIVDTMKQIVGIKMFAEISGITPTK